METTTKSSHPKVLIILAIIAPLLGVLILYILLPDQSQKAVVTEVIPQTIKEEVEITIPKETKPLYISGWLPYWSKDDGVDSLKENHQLFDEINPFAFEVNSDGTIKDTVFYTSAPWTTLSKYKELKIVPTILWTAPNAMHTNLSDKKKREHHIDMIIRLLDKYNFKAVDIDYEGKDIADRDNFSTFIKELKQRLAERELTCTIEARIKDTAPEEWTGKKGMAFANDLTVLSEFCDTVRVMTYDQYFQENQDKTFEGKSEAPQVHNAEKEWVESVVSYMLTYIPAEKLVMGIPTYGWEFGFVKIPDGYRYKLIRSISYENALKEMNLDGSSPVRYGGELNFTRTLADKTKRIVVFSDAESTQTQIDTAKKFGLKGISIFKIDGHTDPKLFDVLKKERGSLSNF